MQLVVNYLMYVDNRKNIYTKGYLKVCTFERICQHTTYSGFFLQFFHCTACGTAGTLCFQFASYTYDMEMLLSIGIAAFRYTYSRILKYEPWLPCV